MSPRRVRIPCGPTAAVAVAAALWMVAPQRAAAQSRLAALVEEERVSEAVELALDDPSGALLAELAREVLLKDIEQPDRVHRAPALAAARGLQDADLVAAAAAVWGSASRWERILVLDVLAVDAGAHVEIFLEALDSPHRPQRIRALMALAEVEDARWAPRLSEVVRHDDDPDVRALAARALGRLAADPAIRDTLRAAIDDSSPAVWEEAATTLFSLADTGVAAALAERLAQRREPIEKWLRLAGDSGQPSLLPALAPFLADPKPEVRAHAAAAVLALHRAEPPLPAP